MKIDSIGHYRQNPPVNASFGYKFTPLSLYYAEKAMEANDVFVLIHKFCDTFKDKAVTVDVFPTRYERRIFLLDQNRNKKLLECRWNADNSAQMYDAFLRFFKRAVDSSETISASLEKTAKPIS